MTFSAGDVVILKSGGQAMTVIAVEDEQAQCLWIGDEGDLFRETIPTVALETAHELESDGEDDEDVGNGDEEDEATDEPQSEKELSPA